MGKRSFSRLAARSQGSTQTLIPWEKPLCHLLAFGHPIGEPHRDLQGQIFLLFTPFSPFIPASTDAAFGGKDTGGSCSCSSLFPVLLLVGSSPEVCKPDSSCCRCAALLWESALGQPGLLWPHRALHKPRAAPRAGGLREGLGSTPAARPIIPVGEWQQPVTSPPNNLNLPAWLKHPR